MATLFACVFKNVNDRRDGSPEWRDWSYEQAPFRIHDVSKIFSEVKTEGGSVPEMRMYPIFKKYELGLRDRPQAFVTYEREFHITCDRKIGEITIKEGSLYTMITFNSDQDRGEQIAVMEFFRTTMPRLY